MSKVVKPNQVIIHVLLEILKNFGMQFPPFRKLRVLIGRTTLNPSISNLDRYVLSLVEKVLKHTGGVKNKTILEIGPGDNLATGLAMLALGAKSYTVLDRFPGDYDNSKAKLWYQFLKENWPYGDWPSQLSLENWINSQAVGIVRESVEESSIDFKFDVICSYAVGEHVSSVSKFATLTSKLLKHDGIAIHHIDFGGHRWDKFGDPFLFLKFPNYIWRLMGSARGEPNRVPFVDYEDSFRESGLEISIYDVSNFVINFEDEWAKSTPKEKITISSATFVLQHKYQNE